MKKNSFSIYTICIGLCMGIVFCLTGCGSTSAKNESRNISHQVENIPEQTQEIRTGEKASGHSRSREGDVILHNTTSGRISIAEARDLALSKVPGAKAENIQIIGGYDDGIVLYQGEIHYNNMEYDFEINAYTGEFTEWEGEALQAK